MLLKILFELRKNHFFIILEYKYWSQFDFSPQQKNMNIIYILRNFRILFAYITKWLNSDTPLIFFRKTSTNKFHPSNPCITDFHKSSHFSHVQSMKNSKSSMMSIYNDLCSKNCSDDSPTCGTISSGNSHSRSKSNSSQSSDPSNIKFSDPRYF